MEKHDRPNEITKPQQQHEEEKTIRQINGRSDDRSLVLNLELRNAEAVRCTQLNTFVCPKLPSISLCVRHKFEYYPFAVAAASESFFFCFFFRNKKNETHNRFNIFFFPTFYRWFLPSHRQIPNEKWEHKWNEDLLFGRLQKIPIKLIVLGIKYIFGMSQFII